MWGYTVKYYIDIIDDICENPENNLGSIQGAINDAKVHYESGNATKGWYESVVRILSQYL